MPPPRIPIRPLPAGAPAAPPPGIGPAVDKRWRLSRVAAAPHRLGFLAGALLLALTAAWWLLALLARQGGLALPWAVASPLAHGLAMALSSMPLFIIGFLFTAGPRWLGLPDVPGSSLVRPVTAYAGGWVAALAGFHLHAALAAAGVAVATLAWAQVLVRFGRLVRASRMGDTLHARAITQAGWVGAATLFAAAAALALEQGSWLRAATQVALWAFLAPVFAIVAHRMLPFFTHSALPAVEAWRPDALLIWMRVALTLTGVAAGLEALIAPLPAAAHALLLAVQAPTAMLLLWLALRWGLVQSFSVKLLAMLHGGFIWLGLAMVLAAAGQAITLWFPDGPALGLASLHALTVGFLGCTLVAMITRVAAGHSGRALVADRIALALYGTVQLAAVSRVVVALWPQAPLALTSFAAAAFAVASTGWLWRYGGWMGRPRVDGRPG